jgi:hypothetical protein
MSVKTYLKLFFGSILQFRLVVGLDQLFHNRSAIEDLDQRNKYHRWLQIHKMFAVEEMGAGQK